MIDLVVGSIQLLRKYGALGYMLDHHICLCVRHFVNVTGRGVSGPFYTTKSMLFVSATGVHRRQYTVISITSPEAERVVDVV